jgi:hypothetical protein
VPSGTSDGPFFLPEQMRGQRKGDVERQVGGGRWSPARREGSLGRTYFAPPFSFGAAWGPGATASASPGQTPPAVFALARTGLLGSGVDRCSDPGAVVRFARRLGVRVATTLASKAAFPNDDPLYLGLVGIAAAASWAGRAQERTARTVGRKYPGGSASGIRAGSGQAVPDVAAVSRGPPARAEVVGVQVRRPARVGMSPVSLVTPKAKGRPRGTGAAAGPG